MLNLTFTSAVRTWLPDRYAVEFAGQWEASEYAFLVSGEALEDLEEIGHTDLQLEKKTALSLFDIHLGTILAAADALWSQSDKMQDEYVLTSSFVTEFKRRHSI